MPNEGARKPDLRVAPGPLVGILIDQQRPGGQFPVGCLGPAGAERGPSEQGPPRPQKVDALGMPTPTALECQVIVGTRERAFIGLDTQSKCGTGKDIAVPGDPDIASRSQFVIGRLIGDAIAADHTAGSPHLGIADQRGLALGMPLDDPGASERRRIFGCRPTLTQGGVQTQNETVPGSSLGAGRTDPGERKQASHPAGERSRKAASHRKRAWSGQ